MKWKKEGKIRWSYTSRELETSRSDLTLVKFRLRQPRRRSSKWTHWLPIKARKISLRTLFQVRSTSTWEDMRFWFQTHLPHSSLYMSVQSRVFQTQSKASGHSWGSTSTLITVLPWSSQQCKILTTCSWKHWPWRPKLLVLITDFRSLLSRSKSAWRLQSKKK